MKQRTEPIYRRTKKEYRIHCRTHYRNYGKPKAASCKTLYLEIYYGRVKLRTKNQKH